MVYKINNRVVISIMAIFSFVNLSCSSNNTESEGDTSHEIYHEVSDSIYIKFDTSYNAGGLSILDIKQGQTKIKPDTNFVAYGFGEYSNLVLLTIPDEAVFPIQRGDSLIVFRKHNLRHPHIKIINNKTFSDQEINFSAELGQRGVSIFEYAFKRTGSLTSRYQATLEALDSCLKVDEVSEKYANWFKKEAEYAYLSSSLIKNITDTTIDVSLRLHSDEDIGYYNYRVLLWRFMSNKLNEKYSLEDVVSVANQYYSGKSRDYILYRFASENLFNEIDNNEVNIKLQQLNNQFTDTGYYTLMKQQFTDIYTADLALDEPLLQIDGQSVSFSEMLRRYKGRIIYLDIWASWCLPCRAEMPTSHKLKEEYKDIAFVYISIDRLQQDWLKVADEEQVVDNSYLFADQKNSEFIKKHEVSTIPRYFILDRDGNIIMKNAPRPSDIHLRSLFDRYLEG